jgi:uncharacterized protein YqkB
VKRRIDVTMAHHLGDIHFGDLAMDRQGAALPALGVFTMRRVAVEGIGCEGPGVETNRLSATADMPPDEFAGKHSS